MKKLEDYHWMCPEPFTNVHTKTLGKMSPCCVMDDPWKVDIKKYGFTEEELSFNVLDSSFRDFWTSKGMQRLRNAMKNGDDDEVLQDFCRVCKIQERSGVQSYREYYLERFNFEFSSKKEELENIIATDSYPSFYHSAELTHLSGNVCNLSCHMCHGSSSSSFSKEQIKIGEDDTHWENRVNTENKFDQGLYDIVNNSMELKFTGGEPLIGNRTYEILKMVEKPEEKIVRMITNATKDVSKFIRDTKKFKYICVNVSIEGIEVFNDYIRYPSEWNAIYDNIMKFMESPHIDTYITTTINALNVGRIYEVPELFGDDILAGGAFVDNNYYSIRSIPLDIRDIYLNRLYSYGKYDIVKRVIKYLENTEFSESDMYGMLTAIRRRDKHRGTNLLDHLPEWKKYYENCIDY